MTVVIGVADCHVTNDASNTLSLTGLDQPYEYIKPAVYRKRL
jgi:hypothetical protein